MALVILVIAGGIGYAVGPGGSTDGNTHTLGSQGRGKRRDRGEG